MGACGGINILRNEQLIVLLHDGLPRLIDEYYAECGVSDRPLAVDWERYAVLEHQGIVKWYGMRQGAALIGMASLCVVKPLHYSLEAGATVDMFFLSKPYRKGRNGDKMLASLMQFAKTEGAKHFTMYERLHATGGRLGKMLLRKGLTQTEIGYSVKLGGDNE